MEDDLMISKYTFVCEAKGTMQNCREGSNEDDQQWKALNDPK